MNARRRLSASLGLAWGALLSGCVVTVVPLASNDAGSSSDAGAVNNPTPDAESPMPAVDGGRPIPAADGGSPMPPPIDGGSPLPPVDGGPVMPGTGGAGAVDLLVVVDNSNSMSLGQGYLNSYLGSHLLSLFQQYGVSDVRVGVVTTDLGTPGSVVPGCANSDAGDDGLLNPRVRGGATRTRNPEDLSSAPFCTPEVLNAPFLTLRSTDDAMRNFHVPACHGRVGVGGCGLEQQLEAAYRALTSQTRRGGPNAGFLRPDATLAILVLSDEDDGSVRDCRYHDGVGSCADAIDVFRTESARWGSADLNLRLYNYDPGSAQDPTWSLDRYVDPARPQRGFLGLKPGHPERIVFGAITGVPISVPVRANGTTNWDLLLGPSAAGRPDDFNSRDSRTAFATPMTPGGPTSMRQRDPDPSCSMRMVPACRSATLGAPTSCSSAEQPFAWRARRIAEVARRFDESALCNGQPCRNGMVASICDVNDSSAFGRFVSMIGRRVVR